MSSENIQFFVPGDPKTKGVKFVRTHFGVKTYTPKEAKSWQENVKWHAFLHRPKDARNKAVILQLTFFLKKPKSKPQYVTVHTRKPDTDNLEKTTLDALQIAGIFDNDAQVFDKRTVKVYSDKPGVLINVTYVTDGVWKKS